MSKLTALIATVVALAFASGPAPNSHDGVSDGTETALLQFGQAMVDRALADAHTLTITVNCDRGQNEYILGGLEGQPAEKYRSDNLRIVDRDESEKIALICLFDQGSRQFADQAAFHLTFRIGEYRSKEPFYGSGVARFVGPAS